MSFSFPKPSRALGGLMIAIVCLWVMFAAAMNWGGADASAFAFLAGDSQAVASGQIWRLVTAALVHNPRNPMHALMVILLLYFFAPALETSWGRKRLFIFFAAAAALTFGIQTIVNLVSPTVAPTANWYGGMGVAEATAVAWAFENRKQVVRLFFVLPMSPLVMVGLFAVLSVLNFIARNPQPEGLITPLAAIAVGYLLCSNSPLRQYVLRAKLNRIQAEVDAMTKQRARQARKKRVAASGFRVIDGDQGGDDGQSGSGRVVH